MNALTRQASTSSSLPAAYVEPTISRALGMAVRDVTNYPEFQHDISPSVYSEAQAELRKHELLCQRITRDQLEYWLTPLAVGVANAPVSDRDIDDKLDAIYASVSDLPACIFTAEMQKAALIRWKFWPTPAEINELLRDDGVRLNRRRDALRKIVGKEKKPDDYDPTALKNMVKEERERFFAAVTDKYEVPQFPPRVITPDLEAEEEFISNHPKDRKFDYQHNPLTPKQQMWELWKDMPAAWPDARAKFPMLDEVLKERGL